MAGCRRKLKMADKPIGSLAVCEYSAPRRSGRYAGVSVGRDREGFFAMTHRARSKSYPAASEIPKKVLKFIESTG